MPNIKCAIYVRKSTEKGLEQDFNSLDNQEQACKAYIMSQTFQGWEYVRTYSDAAISGGTMARPGLQDMLVDIRNGKIG
ncbi:MAG: recombinase family protein, partial [Alphaproteobacteria bacterium]|nr:recombinase family protein [Alphaproteobacteria bacterium]